MLLWGILTLFCLYDTNHTKSQQVQWAKGIFFEPCLIMLWLNAMVVQNLDATGLAAICCTNVLFLFFPSTPAVSTSGRAESRAVQKGPTVLLILETCVSSPVSVPELAVSKSGFSEACWVLFSTTHDMPWVSWNAKYACWELQGDCTNIVGFII